MDQKKIYNRLKEIADQHYGGLIGLAEKMGLGNQRDLYQHKSRPIGSKRMAAFKAVGINDKYLLTGEGYPLRTDSNIVKEPGANYIKPQGDPYLGNKSKNKRTLSPEEMAKPEEPLLKMGRDLIEEETIKIPLLLQSVNAGPGAPLEDFIKEYIEVSERFAKPGHPVFSVRVNGDSMEPFLSDDDLVIFMDVQPENGDVVLAYVNGDATIKRLDIFEDGIELRPLNKKYRAIVPSDEYDFYIKGVMCGYQRQTKRFKGY